MRNRGVILRFARESYKEKQDPCQFAASVIGPSRKSAESR